MHTTNCLLPSAPPHTPAPTMHWDRCQALGCPRFCGRKSLPRCREMMIDATSQYSTCDSDTKATYPRPKIWVGGNLLSEQPKYRNLGACPLPAIEVMRRMKLLCTAYHSMAESHLASRRSLAPPRSWHAPSSCCSPVTHWLAHRRSDPWSCWWRTWTTAGRAWTTCPQSICRWEYYSTGLPGVRCTKWMLISNASSKISKLRQCIISGDVSVNWSLHVQSVAEKTLPIAKTVFLDFGFW